MARIGLSWRRKFQRLARSLDDVQVGFGEILARGLKRNSLSGCSRRTG
jgi:hypothetical protein